MVYDSIVHAIQSKARLFVVTGQAGSGKTTAILQSLILYGRKHSDAIIYELRGEVRSVIAALNLLQKLHAEHVILYVGDLFVFGDTFRNDLESIDAGRVTVISTARSSEWRERLHRHVGDIAQIHDYSRFTEQDYEPLVQKLLRYVPAPAFRKLTPAERRLKLQRSRNQLLIALREATESRSFSDTITDEYSNLPDEDTKLLLVIVAIGIIARVGVSSGVAKEAYDALASTRSFQAAENVLDGIVSRISNGRLFARHELYVRHIVDNLISSDVLLSVLGAMLFSYTKYSVPVIKSVNRVEGALFRFILNHDFVIDQCRRRSRLHDGERLYSAFEVEFQLDGHYWLQYGLYLAACNRWIDALTMMQRSISAYPNNPFAVHAYAETQLKVAARRSQYDQVTMELIGDAVKTLIELDSRNVTDIDQYPIVTLANLHIPALIKHDRSEEALRVAKHYFERLQQLEKQGATGLVTDVKNRILRFHAGGDWDIVPSSPGTRRRGGRQRGRR